MAVTISHKAWYIPANFPSWECKSDTNGFHGNRLNPVFIEKVWAQKHPLEATIADTLKSRQKIAEYSFGNYNNEMEHSAAGQRTHPWVDICFCLCVETYMGEFVAQCFKLYW